MHRISRDTGPCQKPLHNRRIDYALVVACPPQRIQHRGYDEDSILEQVTDAVGVAAHEPDRVLGLDVLREDQHLGLREVTHDAFCGDLEVAGHLGALVPGEGPAQACRQLTKTADQKAPGFSPPTSPTAC